MNGKDLFLLRNNRADWLRQFWADDGHHYLCPNDPQLDDGRYVCVRLDEDDRQVVCRFEKPESGGVENADCMPKPSDVSESWAPPCDSPVGAGDENGWGKQCWSPPQHFCRGPCRQGNGISAPSGIVWTCTKDGGECCPNGCAVCGKCGQIKVSAPEHCRPTGAGQGKSESFCTEFFQKLEPEYQKCIRGNCTQAEIENIANQPACKMRIPDESLKFCRN